MTEYTPVEYGITFRTSKLIADTIQKAQDEWFEHMGHWTMLVPDVCRYCRDYIADEIAEKLWSATT